MGSCAAPLTGNPRRVIRSLLLFFAAGALLLVQVKDPLRRTD